MTVMEIKANKTNLNKIIKWSTSRFNEYKKSEVIEYILSDFKKGKDVKKTYGTGSYSESGNLAGWRYVFTIKNKKATLERFPNPKNIKYRLI